MVRAYCRAYCRRTCSVYSQGVTMRDLWGVHQVLWAALEATAHPIRYCGSLGAKAVVMSDE